MCRLLLTLSVLALACVELPAEERTQGQTPKVPVGRKGIVFAADGIGGNDTMSSTLAHIVERERLPLAVAEVNWSGGNMMMDIWDRGNQRQHAATLARRIQAIRRSCPERKVHLIGYSGGTAVVLAAAAMLPPGGVDRVILLGSGLSSKYDLRPALACAREGIDSFYSTEDNLLEFAGDVVGTPDQGKIWPAGRLGFERHGATPADARLYQKLRQHRWHLNMEGCGHFGGHFGYAKAGFLDTHVLPLLCPDAPRYRR